MTNSILIPLEQQYLLLLSTSSPDQQHLISPPDQQHLIIDYTILPPLTSSPDQQHLISPPDQQCLNYTLLHPLCSSPDQQHLISPPNQQHLILDFMSYSPQPLLQTSSTSFPLLINNVSSFFFFESYLLCSRAMPYVPHLQRSREIGSATDMVNSSPILQGHMVCSTPLLCGVKVCQCIPHRFQYAPS